MKGFGLFISIAFRYLVSKKKTNAINIISWISILGIVVGSFSMFFVLSAINGLGEFIEGLYSSFDPDIKIESVEGKTFLPDSTTLEKAYSIAGVKYIGQSLHENCYVKYRDTEAVVTIKGVDPHFMEYSAIAQKIVEGQGSLTDSLGNASAILGYGIAYRLNLFINGFQDALVIHAANRKFNPKSVNIDDAFRVKRIQPSGIFAINQDFDFKYVLVPIDVVRDLLSYEKQVSSLEITLNENADADAVLNQLKVLYGDTFLIRNRYQLNETLFKTNQTEKWISYAILSFILLIAVFNVVGSLTMLILDKKKDILILKAIGLNLRNIKQIFLLQGLLLALVGGAIGISLSAVLCWLQDTVGIIPLPGAIIDYYPVSMRWSDVFVIYATVIVIGFGASYLPAKFMLGKIYNSRIY